ncbi:RagB/SusD family nutrient uptake outer membrane protein [uncultured Prevotellamassilia sp.]|uniref:RagB/SusD family nutrient uptake outer membrane protein n=1 Tax=uncultured Prevotellamassilia sp. TaxID=1926676 RepID=UPI0025958E80|nr:RagB/SusD family nutrient uptake outer membrane protein [uncultured Prevotellamassilia sp.]
MNKYILKAIFCSALALPLFTSCELDQFPTDSLTDKESWKTYNDATNQYNGLLAILRSDISGSNAYLTDVMSDLFNQRLTSASYGQEHSWRFTGSQFGGDAIWANNYSVILQANFILQNIGKFENSSTLSDQQKANIYNIKATAYFARAYAYSRMVTRYCKDYEPETAANELGLPIVETVSSEAKPARASLQTTCDTIEANLNHAMTYFDKVAEYNERIESSIYKPNADCVTALRARFYLYEHKFDQAIEEAETIRNTYSLASGSREMLNLWILDEGSEIIYEPLQTPDELSGSYGIFLSYNLVTSDLSNTEFKGMNPDFLPTKGLVDLYSDQDVRRKVYFSYPKDGYNTFNLGFGTQSGYQLLTFDQLLGVSADISTTSGDTESGVVFTKYVGNPTLRKQNVWYAQNYNMTKAFRASEAYLIIAEANLRKANPDEAAARDALNELRRNRFEGETDYDGSADYIGDDVTGAALVKVMQDEWTREFVGEGFRLDNLKRWHLGFKRMAAQQFQNPVLVSTHGWQDLEVEANNIRFTWPIPQQETQANKNIKQNEGY